MDKRVGISIALVVFVFVGVAIAVYQPEWMRGAEAVAAVQQ
jgi:hypothetical protein